MGGADGSVGSTIAWTTREKGDLLRASVLMKRAYPQYLSREGAALPPDVLRVTYPIAYWPLIKKYSAAHKLDPYLIAALIAQKSRVFDDVIATTDVLYPGAARCIERLAADYIAQRDVVDAFTGEDSGSGYLAGRPAAAGETRIAARR